MCCGTDPLPELFRAKRYKIKQKFLTKAEFQFIMRNLPVEVSEEDIEDMFAVADTDNDGKLGYQVLLLDTLVGNNVTPLKPRAHCHIICVSRL